LGVGGEAPEHLIAVRTDFGGQPFDLLFGDEVFRQDPVKDFDGGLELLGDHVVGPEGRKGVHLAT